MTPLDHSAAVAAETARFVAAVQQADLTLPVPTCPDWTLADLTRHAGSAQRWFTVLLQQRIQQPPRSRDVDLRLPEQASDYPAWLAESATEASARFTDLDAPMWAWGADQHARFWVRRMLFETLVHRVDAELALGLPVSIDLALATDGIDEFLTNLPFATLFAPHTAKLRAPDRTIRFTTTDTGATWLIHLREDGFALSATDAPADATISATAADLLLTLYGRIDHTDARIELSGDEELLAHWFANSAF